MQISSRRLGAIAVAALMLIALAFGAASAVADAGFAGKGPNSLVVNAASGDEAREDLGLSSKGTAGADASASPDEQPAVVADVYQLATAKRDGSSSAMRYQLASAFKGVKLPANLAGLADGSLLSSAVSAADWQSLADAASALVLDGAVKADRVSIAADGKDKAAALDDGLYLVCAHGPGVEGALAANGAWYRYEFQPTVVALPTKAADATGAIGTADSFGPWVPDASITLKSEQKPLYGSLVIDKTVDTFAGEPATFVFHITGERPDGEPYDNYASVYLSSGTSASNTVEHIPAGTQVSVEEVYTGPRFVARTGVQKATIVSDAAVEAGGEQARVAFENEMNTSALGGHGIENSFELGTDGDWTWSQYPSAAE